MARSRPASPAAVLLRVFFLASFLWFALPWLIHLTFLDGQDCYHLTPAAVAPDLASIQQRLAAGQDQRMHALFPEGRLFSHSFYGFTLINLSAANPQDVAFRQHTLAELAGQIPQVEALATQPPYDTAKNLTPTGGIIAAGHPNLLRAGYAVLGGTDPALLAAFHTQSEIIFQAFSKSPVASVETYPDQIWPVDNLAALESLRLHDVLYHTAYSQAADRWAQYMAAHFEPSTGMMNMQISPTGAIADGPRGCGLSWMLAFLPNLAPDLARQQYDRYRQNWFSHPLGTTGIREFPPGRTDTFTDSDTGPIIFSLGTGATGFGIAAAKANHDVPNLTGLLRALDLCSLPAYSTDLSHSHFAGQVLLADEIALWGQTLTRWDAPTQLPPEPAPPTALHNFWMVIAILTLACTLLTWLLTRWTLRAFQVCRREPGCFGGSRRIFFILAAITLVAFLILPPMNWLYTFFALAILDITESRFGTRAQLSPPDQSPSPSESRA